MARTRTVLADPTRDAGLADAVPRSAMRPAQGLKLVIDHLGLTQGKDAEAFVELDKVLALARHPNVAVKTSCLPHFASKPYPFASLHPYLRRVYDAFGPQRMLWGTDLSRSPCSYQQNITMFTEEIPWLSADDKAWIMGRGICEWIGWK